MPLRLWGRATGGTPGRSRRRKPHLGAARATATSAAGDTASSEDAVLHALDAYEAMHGELVDVVLLVQCTSPFLTAAELDGVAAAVVEEGADTALTVARFHGFLWRDGEDSNGVNHD